MSPTGRLGIIELELVGSDETIHRLEQIQNGMLNLRPAFDKVGDAVIDMEKDRWAAARWPKLAESTLARKRRQGLPTQALKATGLLERTMTLRGVGHGQFMDISREGLDFGIRGGANDIFYGRIVQKGHRPTPHSGRMPPRLFLPKRLPVKTRKRVTSIILDHILGR